MADNKLIPPSKNKLPWYEQALSMEGRAAFLPFQDTLPGSVMNQRSFALPGIIAGAANAITAPGRAYSGSDPMFDPQEEAANFAMNVMGGGMGASRAAPAGSLGMNTWHGSPHRFPPTAKNPLGEFDPMKVGTGEGAQSYGVGAGYLAENRTTGQTYNPNPGIASAAWDKSMKYWTDKLARNDNPVVAAKEIAILKEKMANQTGYLYKVDLPDEQIAKMLDWDKPLSQQVDLGQKISPESLGLTYKQLENGNHAFVNSEGKILGNLQKNGSKESFTKNWIENVLQGSGRDLYNQLGQGMGGGAKVSEALRQAGIPGIRYLDQGSRAGGKGTSNFVVFDPKHMNIIGRE